MEVAENKEEDEGDEESSYHGPFDDVGCLEIGSASDYRGTLVDREIHVMTMGARHTSPYQKSPYILL
jgi:hypothetical protein